MRTSKTLIGLLMVALTFLAACGGGSPTPGTVAKNFLSAINDLNFEEAKQYATAESASMLDMLSGIMAMSEEEMEKPEAREINVTNEEIDGDNATVTYTTKDEEGNDVEESIDLVKVDGAWKVKFDKGSMGMGDGLGDMDMEEDDMEEEIESVDDMEYDDAEMIMEEEPMEE